MRLAPRDAATVFVASFVLFSSTAALAAKPFVGPDGWDHTVAVTPTPQLPRAQESWKKADGEVLIYLSDGGLSYDDTVAAVKKNVADNAIKTAVDRDRTCAGKRAHEIELTFAPTIVHQIIVDEAPGVTKLTYSRPVGTAMAADATAAITSYCGS
ncbi:MAG TPA: hypothetical protein VGN14_17725 [Candidatus Elarobacter sp.]|jgi:hypothetical protein